MDEIRDRFWEQHREHAVSALPFVTEDGWDARQLECLKCGDTLVEVRAMPAEGALIDPDPHLS